MPSTINRLCIGWEVAITTIQNATNRVSPPIPWCRLIVKLLGSREGIECQNTMPALAEHDQNAAEQGDKKTGR